MNIPEELLKQIDTRAKELNVTRTAYLVMTISQQLKAEEITKSLPELQRMMTEAMAKQAFDNKKE